MTSTGTGPVRTDDGVRLWAARSGTGAAPLILVHGGPGLWDMFGPLATALGDLATVIRWDQRGCGRSERCAGPWTLARFVADLDAVRAHFGLERTALLGHSWGAQLALAYTLAHPERVSTLVYVSGTGIGPVADWQGRYKANFATGLAADPARTDRFEALMDRDDLTVEEEREYAALRWALDFTDRAPEHGSAPAPAPDRGPSPAGHALALALTDPWFGVNHACNHALNEEARRTWGTPELRAACAALDVPVLIVDGAKDIRPRDAVDSLEAALPRVRRVVFPDAGHLPWIEEPEGFRRALEGLAVRHPPQTPGAGCPGREY
ncbi:alpha/beta hydrolase [Streptomyces sp. NPDC093252]|uniref:alpha/beta fold hydrolase n=1 Tax=Streptomyces sp. NPDC093252 TaxID=3154980 RepID=UPI00342F21D3